MDLKLKQKITSLRFPQFVVLIIVVLIATLGYLLNLQRQAAINKLKIVEAERVNIETQLNNITNELETLKNVDQYKLNQELNEEIANIRKTYTQVVKTYEELLDLKDKSTKTAALDQLFAQSLSLLSEAHYASASAILAAV